MAKKPVNYVMEAAKRWPNNEFLHIPAYAPEGGVRVAASYTYAETMLEIEELKAVYFGKGISAGVRVGLMLENNAAFFFHWLALNALDAAIVPLNKELGAEDCAHIIRDSKLSLICCFNDLLPVARAALELVQSEVVVWSVNGGEMPVIKPAVVAEAGECALLYTSGSTGLPKGCILSDEYFEIAGQDYKNLVGLCTLEEGAERLATPLPLVHMNALACSTMAMIMTGGCIIQLDRFHPRSWWQLVKDTRATVIHYLGVMPAILLQLPESPTEKHHHIKFAFGAGVNPKHHRIFEERFGFPLIEAWSMTEVGAAAWVVANDEPRHVGECCFGKPASQMEYRLVDGSGSTVPVGTSGELLVRRSGADPRKGFFAGYYGKPEQTEEAWQGGWFHTGDIVKADAQGSLYFVDRKKSIIRRSGENISALEVEAVLSEFSGVQSVGVTPVPDEIRGEEVLACFVMGGDKSGDLAAEIIAHALDRLAYYKVPGYIAFLDELPLTPSQKLKRGDLKKLGVSLVGDGGAYDMRYMKKRQKAS